MCYRFAFLHDLCLNSLFFFGIFACRCKPGGYGQAELFRTIRPSIDEEQWNVIAKESEQRRNISLYTEGTNGSPTSFNQSQQASIDFNNNKTTGIEAETKTAEPSEEQKQVDASGRVYTSTTITEEDQDDLWERYIIYVRVKALVFNQVRSVHD